VLARGLFRCDGVTRDEISESDQIRDVTYILGRAKKKITRVYGNSPIKMINGHISMREY